MSEAFRDQFDLIIGRLDRILSEVVHLSRIPDLDEYDKQTLKHHAEDMEAAAKHIMKKIGGVEGTPQPQPESQPEETIQYTQTPMYLSDGVINLQYRKYISRQGDKPERLVEWFENGMLITAYGEHRYDHEFSEGDYCEVTEGTRAGKRFRICSCTPKYAYSETGARYTWDSIDHFYKEGRPCRAILMRDVPKHHGESQSQKRPTTKRQLMKKVKELRSTGMTFYEIEATLGISHSTANSWERSGYKIKKIKKMKKAPITRPAQAE